MDRVLEMEVSLLGRSSRIITKQIIIELTGKNANLIFAENGKILDSMKHVSPLMSSVRVIQPCYDYFPPPAQSGLNILCASPEKIVASIPDEVNKAQWKQLVANTAGIGKYTAEQLFFQANIPFNATYLIPSDRKKLAEAIACLQEVVRNSPSAFTVLISKSNQCTTIFPYNAVCIPKENRVEHFSSINDAICFAVQLHPVSLPKKEELKQVVKTEIHKTDKKIDALKKDLADANDAENYRIIADSLMASLYQIPRGSTSCTVSNIYDGSTLAVSLSPSLTPAENAQKYYKTYNKLKRARKEVSIQLSQAEQLLIYLESVSESLNFAATRLEIEEIREELQKEGLIRKTKKSRPVTENPHRSKLSFPTAQPFTLEEITDRTMK